MFRTCASSYKLVFVCKSEQWETDGKRYTIACQTSRSKILKMYLLIHKTFTASALSWHGPMGTFEQVLFEKLEEVRAGHVFFHSMVLNVVLICINDDIMTHIDITY